MHRVNGSNLPHVEKRYTALISTIAPSGDVPWIAVVTIQNGQKQRDGQGDAVGETEADAVGLAVISAFEQMTKRAAQAGADSCGAGCGTDVTERPHHVTLFGRRYCHACGEKAARAVFETAGISPAERDHSADVLTVIMLSAAIRQRRAQSESAA